MKVEYLGQTNNQLKLSGKIKNVFSIAEGQEVTFGEGATFQGKLIPPGTRLYNAGAMSMKIGQSISGALVLMPTSPIIHQTSEDESESSDEEYEERSGKNNEFFVYLEKMRDEYLIVERAVDQLELGNKQLERELKKIQQKFSQIKLPQVAVAIEIEELSESESAEKYSTEFDRSINTVYDRYDLLERTRISLTTRKETLESVLKKAKQEMTEIIEAEQSEAGYESDDEEESETEIAKYDVTLGALQKKHQELQASLDTLVKEVNSVGDMIEQAKGDASETGGSISAEALKVLEERFKSLQISIQGLEKKEDALDLLLKNASSLLTTDVEIFGEEVETESESSSLKWFATQLQAQTSKLEELAPPPLLSPPLVRSPNLTVKEWEEVFAIEPTTNRPATDGLSGDGDSTVNFWCCS